MSLTHKLPQSLANSVVGIEVVGAGGNGAQIVGGLARLDAALRATGHDGLHVTLIDPDRVTEANVGRQLFSPSDIGRSKAAVLIHRINLFYGTRWTAICDQYAPHHSTITSHIVIGCVDTKRARRKIFTVCQRFARYWLDLGNSAREGQVVLGEPVGSGSMPRIREKLEKETRLPTVLELFPEVADRKSVEDDTPSCSLAEALDRQDLFINQTVATFALHLLWTWFRHGEIRHHGYFINLDAGIVRPLPIDPQVWDRMRQPKQGARAPKSSRKTNAVRTEKKDKIK